METAIRWSPSSTTTEQRFLIADVNGHAFRYCAVEHYDKKEFRYETLSTHHKVPAFRAFDWSPHDEAIVAVGQWSGEATVLRIDDQSQSLSLPIRHQRLCNAVSFSRTGLLATGLERVRNDFCLNVWDISQRLSAKSSSSTGSGKTSMDPVRKLASSEAITSIKFFPSQPDVLVCGVKGVSIRIYDTRDHTGNPSFHFHTSCVNNIAIDPLDENYFASAGPVKDTTIHLFDRRWSSSTAVNIATNATNGNQHGPILEFRKAFDNPNSSALPSVWSLRYCKGQSGCLAALASTGEYKIFETKKEHIPETGSLKGQQTALNEPISYPQKLLTKRIHHVERAFDDKNHRRSENKRIVSFDFTNLAGSNGRPCTITVRGNQTIEIYELQGPSPSLSVSPMGTIAISKATPGTGFSSDHSVTLDEFAYMIRPLEAGTIAKSLKNIRAKLNDELSVRPEQNLGIVENAEGFNRAPDKKPHLSSREAHEAMNFHPSNVALGIRDALDMFTISRRRCAEGYLFDSKKNCDILSDDPWLQDLWTWIGRMSLFLLLSMPLI